MTENAHVAARESGHRGGSFSHQRATVRPSWRRLLNPAPWVKWWGSISFSASSPAHQISTPRPADVLGRGKTAGRGFIVRHGEIVFYNSASQNVSTSCVT